MIYYIIIQKKNRTLYKGTSFMVVGLGESGYQRTPIRSDGCWFGREWLPADTNQI